MDSFLPNSSTDQAGQHSLTFSNSLGELVDQAIGFARRQYPILVFFAACAIALGFVYLFTTTKEYTAHALLLMDTTKTRVLQQNQQAFGELPLDTAGILAVNTAYALITGNTVTAATGGATGGGGIGGAINGSGGAGGGGGDGFSTTGGSGGTSGGAGGLTGGGGGGGSPGSGSGGSTVAQSSSLN